MSEFGRISGPLLKANLERDGIDLAFETDLLYLSVLDTGDPGKPIAVGIKNDAPQRALHIGNDIVSEHRTFQTTNLIVDNSFDSPKVIIDNNKISNLIDELYLAPNPLLDPKVVTKKIGTLNLRISDKLIENITNNSDINLAANGAGSVVFNTTKVDVDGDLHATGDITWDGNITFGNNSSDNVTFSSDIASNLIPNIDNNFDLGTISKQWNNLFVNEINTSIIETPSITANGINLLLRQGNVWYVSKNGSDSNTGDHLHDTFLTIKHALSQATFGDEVLIFPGTYEEIWPLEIPQGVTVKGSGIRGVTIVPTVETNSENCFLLNGETTVEYLTIKDFYAPGYAFALAPGYSSSTKSPYIYNITVITKGSVTSESDPRGFNEGDAGGGAYIDGSVADPNTQLPPTALFFSTTFIVPNGKGILATNKARIEWLNSFTYFAETGIKLETGTSGIGGTGNTRVTIQGVEGTVEVGDTFTYYDQSGSVVLGTGTIIDIDGDLYTLDGYVGGLELIDEVTGNTFVPVGTAIISQARAKFGTASLYLDGSSYVTGSDNFKFTLSNNDFCIEKWIYPLAFPTGEATLVSHWGASSAEQAFKLVLTATGGLKLYLNDGSSSTVETGIEYLLTEDGQILTTESGDPIISENSAIVLNLWQHVAVVRNGDVVTLYINGIDKASINLAVDAVINDATGSFNFGFSTGDSEYFNGYIDEVRLSKNNPRFISEFTPPTVAYANVDVDTYILMHLDGDTGSVNFVDISTTTQNIEFTNATATRIVALDYTDFAAEMRSINSANVYGVYGAVAEGRDTLGYLIGHNFGYIGSGGDSSNDRSLVIQANEVVEISKGKIYYDSVDHKGDYRVGDIFYVNQETGDVVFNAEAVNFLPTGNIVLEGPSGSTIINSQFVQTGNLRIYDNTVASITGPVNWSAFSGTTTLQTNVNVTGNIDITGDFTVDGTIYLGNDVLDTITFNSKLSQDIIPDTTGLTLGEPGKLWRSVYSSLLNVDNVVEINSNTISVLTTDANLSIIAAGTGSVLINNADVEIDNDLTIGTGLSVNTDTSLQDVEIVGSITHVGDIDQTGNYNLIGNVIAGNYVVSGIGSYFEVPDIKILNNEISITALDTDLELFGNGSGGVRLDNYLKFTNSTISNIFSPAVNDQQRSITISPNGTGNLVIDSVRSLQIPVGNNSNRILSSNGEIRFNNLFNGYEGFDRTGNVSLSGLFNQLRDTYITPELTIGANDNILRFAVNNTVRATIDSTKLYTPRLDVGNITISGNTINNTSLTNDINFVSTGTGTVNVNSLSILDDKIENTKNTPLIIQSTGTGYVKFNGTGAIVIPYGNNSERRLTPEVGEVRTNNENPEQWTMEVFDGVTWIPAVGTSGAASLEDIEDTLNLYSLILG